MYKFTRSFLVLVVAAGMFSSIKSLAWGFWGHQRINRIAVFNLPPELFGFFKYYIDHLTSHSVDPDKRRYAVETEAPCHYIDLDHYGTHPFDSLPLRWEDAVTRFGTDSLMAHGIVPWHLVRVFYRLTNAFRNRDRDAILHNASDLGHYIGDAHVPLHCTSNYNGQQTGQTGIHGFWESRIPELFGDNFDFVVPRFRYITNPQEEAWNIIRESHAALDSVLGFEKMLAEKMTPDRKYAYEQKGNLVIRVYASGYAKAYNDVLDGMVERRMRQAIYEVSSFWYTAWVNAGQPDLAALISDAPVADASVAGAPADSAAVRRIPGHEE